MERKYGCSSKKLKIALLYNPEIPLLGIYLKKKKALIQKDICTPMFIAALSTIAKIQKQPVSTDRRMDEENLIHTHTHTHTHTRNITQPLLRMKSCHL